MIIVIFIKKSDWKWVTRRSKPINN